MLKTNSIKTNTKKPQKHEDKGHVLNFNNLDELVISEDKQIVNVNKSCVHGIAE